MTTEVRREIHIVTCIGSRCYERACPNSDRFWTSVGIMNNLRWPLLARLGSAVGWNPLSASNVPCLTDVSLGARDNYEIINKHRYNNAYFSSLLMYSVPLSTRIVFGVRPHFLST